MSVEITAFHVACLGHFVDKRALTETGLARLAKCEKAVAKFAINTLLKAGYLKRLGAYEYALTSDGELHLKGKKPATTTKPVKDVALEELEVLNLPPSDPVGSQQLADTLADQVEEPAASDPAADKLKAEVAIKEQQLAAVLDLPAPEQADFRTHVLQGKTDFRTLVLQGLARLNEQMGLRPVEIQNSELKVEVLTSLSVSLKDFDRSLSMLLADVARDIQRVDNRSS